MSAFDVVMKEPIPYKGAVLTQITAWWLRHFASEVHHHLVSADVGRDRPARAVARQSSPNDRRPRHAVPPRATVFPVECVVRGYISGSAWKEYREHGTLAGEPLPPGLREADRFDHPIFSPATKAESGHDENITVADVRRQLGADVAAELERLSRHLYELGRAIAAERGIIIADTKFEFGRDAAGAITLIDEVLTPDSSRFWPADRYVPGRTQPSFDKQPLRDYLDGERRAGRWNGDAPPPPLPPEVVRATSERYLDAFRRITGTPLALEGLS